MVSRPIAKSFTWLKTKVLTNITAMTLAQVVNTPKAPAGAGGWLGTYLQKLNTYTL